MIGNIIDRRKRPYRWRAVKAVVEAIEHDNSVPDADQAAEADVNTVVDYHERLSISVRDAILWATELPCEVTLYLYDLGGGPEGTVHFDAQAIRFSDE
ncbi:hypothetical protein [Phenylobacterium aquaticum]|uniref:hypothetical protein n=1 Tax=Phenylobacterium aquaticum TaxID=1763816 RepID=UPI001F5E06F8|nr:hypothetical protein [Phenylobacterium aquaticum]MCI3135024.1 hypothetical protein [Phenylobacterium aquaticum]